MGEVIRFPTEEILRRDLLKLRAERDCLRFGVRVRRLLSRIEDAERAIASAPPGARAMAALESMGDDA